MAVHTYNRDIQQTPVWNEVKGWNMEDKQALIKLLYLSMGDSTFSNKNEQEEGGICIVPWIKKLNFYDNPYKMS